MKGARYDRFWHDAEDPCSAATSAAIRGYAQLDTADRQEPSEALTAKTANLKEKLAKLEEEMTDRASGLSPHSPQLLLPAPPAWQDACLATGWNTTATQRTMQAFGCSSFSIAISTECNERVNCVSKPSDSGRSACADVVCQELPLQICSDPLAALIRVAGY